MNSPSAFQAQYPLSRKKFWKKMISRSIALLVGSVFFAGMLTVGVMLLIVAKDTTTPVPSYAILGILLFVIGIITIPLLYGLYVSAYIRRYYYDATEQFLTIQKGVFAPTEIHVPYGKIQDVYVDQDILDRIMGLYDVHIASATVTSGIEAHIDGVDEKVAEGLKVLLLNRIQYGGTMAQTQSVPPSPSQGSVPPQAVPTPQGPQPGVYSTKTYPIMGGYLVSAFIANIYVSAIYAFFIYFFFGRLGAGRGLGVDWPYALLLFAIIYVAFAIWVVLWRMTFSFEFQPQFILMRSGVISRQEKHVPYRTLQNVLLRRGFVERMLGLSTVIIENAAMGYGKNSRASRITIPGQPVAKGTELVDELNRIIAQTPGSQGTGL